MTAPHAPGPRADVLHAQGLALRVWVHAAPMGAPRALVVHGHLDTGRSFDALARELPDVEMHALDLRGHGQSDRVGAGGSYHLLDHMKDVAIALDTLKPDVLVGHSMGGNIALLVAGARPALVRSLVLVDTFGPPPEDPTDQPERLSELVLSVLQEKRPYSTVASIDEAAERVRAQNSGLSPEGARRMVEHVLVPRADGRFDFPFDPRLRGPSPVRWPEAFWLAMCRRLTSVSMPVTLVRATDGYVPEGETLDARRAAMRATLATIEGPHHLHVEQPAALAAILRQHLFASRTPIATP